MPHPDFAPRSARATLMPLPPSKRRLDANDDSERIEELEKVVDDLLEYINKSRKALDLINSHLNDDFHEGRERKTILTAAPAVTDLDHGSSVLAKVSGELRLYFLNDDNTLKYLIADNNVSSGTEDILLTRLAAASGETRGDMIIRTASAFVRLGVGANGEVVKSDGTDILWGAGAAGGTPALTFGSANTPGSATTFIRTDDILLLFDATVPTTIAFGDAAAAGSGVIAALRNHVHGMVVAPPVTCAAAWGADQKVEETEAVGFTGAETKTEIILTVRIVTSGSEDTVAWGGKIKVSSVANISNMKLAFSIDGGSKTTFTETPSNTGYVALGGKITVTPSAGAHTIEVYVGATSTATTSKTFTLTDLFVSAYNDAT